MQTSIQQAEIMGALKYTSKATSKLDNRIRLESKADCLTIESTNGRMAVRAKMEAQVVEPGTICVDGPKFAEAIRSVRETISLKLSNNKLAIAGRFRLGVLPTEDFPPFPAAGDLIATVDVDTAIKRTMYATAEDNSRPLEGILFDGSNLVATDVSRLAIAKVDANFAEQLLLPAALLRAVVGLGATSIYDAEYYVIFEANGVEMAIAKMQGQFPLYQSLIPADSNERVMAEFHRDHLTDVLERAAVVSENVKIDVVDGQAIFSAQKQDDEFEESIPVENRNTGTAHFRTRFILDFLRAGEGGVRFSFEGQKQGLLESDDYQYVIMPVRV